MINFSKWYRWKNRLEISNLYLPGVYALSISEENLESSKFNLHENICYFGVTISVSGLKGRLKQFDNAIKNGIWNIHGGAERLRFKYNNYDELIPKLFVSVRSFDCNVRSNDPNTLLIKGKIVEFEYVCFAEYVKNFGKLPEFNDLKRSLKK